ncbi:hypothetical protein BDY24DRAFT_339283 [Mrakia frigida]|uniref:iron-containing alcohol dehydrogenase n=1 Tax=Mrakia frigida TaxID=29902 RepID=UPI003FCBF107
MFSHLSALSGNYTPTPLQIIEYGPGSLSLLPELIHKLAPPPSDSSPTKVLVVTGTSLTDKTPVIQDIQALLEKADVESVVFKGIGQHAPIQGIRDAVDLVLKEKCTVLVSVGGGSPIDAAKAIAYFVKDQTKSERFMPQIAIPTTLSAAEFTMNAGYSDESGSKVGVSDALIVPRAIILDANLSLHTPQRLWLSTGIRALDHALESLYRKGSQGPLKHLALAAVQELFVCLPLCTDDSKNVDVRARLQIAAWESLWLNSVPTAIGLSHSLGHKLGATYSIPHGICSCLTLPPTLLLLSSTLPLTSWGLVSLASALAYIPSSYHPTDQLPPTTVSSEENTLRADAWKVGKAVEKLVNELGLGGGKLERDYGVKREELGGLAEAAMKGLEGWEGMPGWEEVEREVLGRIY